MATEATMTQHKNCKECGHSLKYHMPSVHTGEIVCLWNEMHAEHDYDGTIRIIVKECDCVHSPRLAMEGV